MSLKDFLNECNNRQVLKRLSIYIVSSWVILQVLSVVAEPLGLPDKTITYLIIILLIGLPIYMFILWKSKVRHSKSSSDADLESKIFEEIQFKRMYFIATAAIGFISIISTVLIIKNNPDAKIVLPKVEASKKIAVLNFDNNTGDSSLDAIGKISAEWLINGITLNEVGEVISSDVVDDYSHVLGFQINASNNQNILDKFFQPSKIINGSYIINNDRLVINCSVMQGSDKKVLIAFQPVRCDQNSPLDCIEALREQVLGYLITNGESINLENRPPKFKAYKKVLDAQANFSDSELYLKLLNEAIAIDSNYFEPKIHRIQHYYNESDYQTTDSLIKALNSGKRLNKNQQYFLNYLKALTEGKNNNCFRYHEYDYKNAPFNIASNATQMILALNYINKPELVEDIFNKIEMDEMLLENCSFCAYRYLTMAAAYNQLGQYEKVIELLTPIVSVVDIRELNRQLLVAYVRSDQESKAQDFLKNYKMAGDTNDIIDLNLFIAREFILKGNNTLAEELLNSIIEDSEASSLIRAKAYYYKGAHSEALALYKEIYNSGNTAAIIASRLAVCYNKLNMKTEENQMIEALNSLREVYDFGVVDYCYSQYLIATQQTEQALEYLLRSIAKGNKYADNTFQNDSHFKDVLNSPKFKEILTYWHK